MASLRCSRLLETQFRSRTVMYEILVIVLGTGGIMLMAAYAELCELI
jgi:hypothetical protein